MSLQRQRDRNKISVFATLILIFGFQFHSFSQQTFYDVTSGNGNGVRFWSDDIYKIHMGNASEYWYGPVTGYSIKMNMSGTAGRGWTWGVSNQEPIAALSNVGDMKISGTFSSDKLGTSLSSGTMIQLDHHSYGKAHMIYFNAYKSGSASGSVGADGNSLFASSVGSNKSGAASIIYYANGGSMGFYISGQSTGAGDPISWGNPMLWLQRNGNVGIGQSNPSDKLTVAGNIRATEVKVEAQWWDAVFEEDYMLTPLSEVEDYVKENHHLPEIPSEAEISENGVSLGETVGLLLKKIEELTLYTIEQQKEIEVLKYELSAIKLKK